MFNIVEVSYTDDCAAILSELENICFPHDYWTLESLKGEMQKSSTCFFVAVESQEIIGYVCFSLLYDEAELNRICVLPQYRSKGIGSRLMDFLINKLKALSCAKLMLEVRSTNSEAVALYKKFGFKTDFVRKGYYLNPPDDAILMTLTF